MPRLIEVPSWFRAPKQKFPDAEAAIRYRFASSVEAETYAASLGIAANYSGRTDIANWVSELFTQLKERGIPLPESTITDVSFFAFLGQASTDAVAMAENGALLVNPSATFWNLPIDYAIALYEARFWSTPNPMHPLIHEIGHLLQDERGTRGKPLTPAALTEAKAISDRAQYSIDEFVAEVFVGLYCGVRYDVEIMARYKRYGGRLP